MPSLLGLLARRAIGEERAARAGSGLKLLSATVLLLLCYMNAAVALPQAVAEQDWDFLAVLFVLVAALCVGCFAGGWALGRLVGADAGQRAALMFGLGMNNNGTGLVLASTALATLPGALLPVIVYNLLQHLVAGAVALRIGRDAASDGDKADGNTCSRDRG